jgi:hypothetical protein
MNEKTQQHLFGYQIKKIKCLSFKINEDIEVDLPTLMVNLNYRTTYNIEGGYFDFALDISFSPKDKPDVKCMEFDILNRFAVLDLAKYIDKETESFNFPPQVLVNILSLSISHSRAIISQQIGGTKYNDVIIPITDALPLATQFFNLKLEPNTALPK